MKCRQAERMHRNQLALPTAIKLTKPQNRLIWVTVIINDCRTAYQHHLMIHRKSTPDVERFAKRSLEKHAFRSYLFEGPKCYAVQERIESDLILKSN